MELITDISSLGDTPNYLILFFIYLIEGPIANLISAFLAGKGFLNIWYVFLLAAFAEILADIIFFLIGHLVRGGFVSKFLNRVEKRSKVFRELKDLIHESPFLMIFFIKMFAPISIAGLLYIGQEGMPWKTFLKYGIPLSIVRNIVITVIGFTLITSLDMFLPIYNTYKTVITILSILLLVLFLFLLSREDLEILILRYTKNKRVKT